ncbi:hypothetical protein HMPREF3227_00044 [Corynebacterium sp. CMW7794]|nr:hypothetical protein HMPREF0307_01614 [Corynebacterium sp. DNF00584]KXI19881.1 hypothetical protein HMPREF3227_00044 [Corynebacterium sp. CMW7794]MBF9010403.1 O-methyltransferase [Corynebacterium phoceense]
MVLCTTCQPRAPAWTARISTVTSTAYNALLDYIDTTTERSEALRAAYAHAEEFSLPAPGVAVGQLLATLTAGGVHAEKPQAIAITPAVSVAGLYLLEGLPEGGILSCIDPEAEHQANAKQLFRTAGHPTSRVRFLPSRPLDVIGRLANESYHVIYADVPTMDLQALTKAAWPLLTHGGTLVLAGALLDGTLADTSRTDRTTTAAREADEFARSLEDAVITRLPLESGITLVTKR